MAVFDKTESLVAFSVTKHPGKILLGEDFGSQGRVSPLGFATRGEVQDLDFPQGPEKELGRMIFEKKSSVFQSVFPGRGVNLRRGKI